jgi:hypothetical protein
LLTSCGTITVRSKGNVTMRTESTVQSTSTVVLTVDIGACENVPTEQRIECIRALVDLYKELNDVEGILQCVRDPRPASGTQGTHPTVSCGRDPVAEAAGQNT